jgi:thiol:disulfide interchange protein DsbD
MPELARKFPRTGPWSDLFKQEMGFLMLAAATYFAAGRLIAGPQFFWAVVLMMAIAAVFLMARTVQLTPNAMPVAIVSTLAVVLVAAPLWWTMKITAAAGQFTHFTDEAFQQARSSGKPVLVKFTANWCSTCQVIEGTVFRDDHVWQVLKDRGFEVMKVDFSTSEDVPGHDLLLELNPAGGIPLTAIYTPGNAKPVVLSSVYTSEELLNTLNRSASVARASAE